MKRKSPSDIVIQTWIDIARKNKSPEAQKIATSKIEMFFDDVSQAELYLELDNINQLGNLNKWKASHLAN